MPYDADAPVARLAARPLARLVPPGRVRHPACRYPLCGAQRLLHRRIHGVELVVAGHLLDELAAAAGRGILEHDEMAQ